MKPDIQFGNYTDNVLCSYVGNSWLIVCVHPTVHQALCRMLNMGSEATKVAVRKIVEQPWFPAVFAFSIETGQDTMKVKLCEMSSEHRQNVLRYSLDARFEDVGTFTLDYLEQRFNARTPEFTTFRGFYVHLKNTDPVWLHQDGCGSVQPSIKPALSKR